jgi:CheY-like chemotaxis protein
MKILIVEDNEQNRALLRIILQHYGHETMEAENGKQGVAMTKEHRPDLIMMDLQMPVMDGFEAMRIIRNNPELKNIKIIAVTSYAMKGDREKAMNAGADEYIAKPIDTHALPDIISRLLTPPLTNPYAE